MASSFVDPPLSSEEYDSVCLPSDANTTHVTVLSFITGPPTHIVWGGSIVLLPVVCRHL